MAEKAEAAKAAMEEESARSREEGEEARRRAEDLDVLFASSSGDVKRLLREIGSLGQVREGSRWSDERVCGADFAMLVLWRWGTTCRPSAKRQGRRAACSASPWPARKTCRSVRAAADTGHGYAPYLCSTA